LSLLDAVVPVAGLGTRLLPATKSQPKEMLPVVGKPVVQYVVEELAAVGIERVLFVTGRGKSSIEDHFDPDRELIQTLRATGREQLLAELEFERMGVEFLYTRQAEPLGLGDAVLCASDSPPSDPSHLPSATRSSGATGARPWSGRWARRSSARGPTR
jgi:UTP--glucose-1-phosphate uridylyltransferase